MTRSAALIAAFLSTLATPAQAADPGGATDAESLALVVELRGEVVLEREDDGANAASPVARFDWLPAGSTLRVGPTGQAVVVLFSGERLALGPESSGRISGRGLVDREGDVERLAPTSPLPRVVPPAGTRDGAAAVDLSGEGLRLYPSGGARSLAEATVLRFGHDARLGPFRVQIATAAGRRIFEATTAARELTIRPGVLEPGASYLLSVAARDGLGMEHVAEATFSTLSKDETRLRAALRDLVPAGDADTFLYLARIDRDLGLHWEWVEAVRRALESSFTCPHPTALSLRLREPCEERPFAPELVGRS